MGLVQDDHPGPAQAEHEARGQALHDVLAVDSVGHEGHRSLVTMLICGAANTGGLHNYIINNTTCNGAHLKKANFVKWK